MAQITLKAKILGNRTDLSSIKDIIRFIEDICYFDLSEDYLRFTIDSQSAVLDAEAFLEGLARRFPDTLLAACSDSSSSTRTVFYVSGRGMQNVRKYPFDAADSFPDDTACVQAVEEEGNKTDDRPWCDEVIEIAGTEAISALWEIAGISALCYLTVLPEEFFGTEREKVEKYDIWPAIVPDSAIAPDNVVVPLTDCDIEDEKRLTL